MRKRVLTGAVGIILATALVMTVCCGFILQRRRIAVEEGHLRGLAQVLARGFTEYDVYTDYAQRVAEHTGYYVTVVSAEGEVLDTSLEQLVDTQLMQQEEFVQARVSGEGFAVRHSAVLGVRVMCAVCRADDGTYIRIAIVYPSFWQNIAAVLPAVLLSLIITGLLAVWASAYFARSIQQPITDFSAALDGVMEGGDKLRPDLYPYEELQDMAMSINHLSDEVEAGLVRVEKEHQKLDTILDSMREGFVLLSWDEEVLVINDTACRVLGFVKGTGYNSLVFVTRDIGILDAVAEVKKTGAVRRVEYGAANGAFYTVSVSPTAAEEDGLPQGIVLLLNESGDHLGSVNVRQDFFASASHELKTPITSVRGFAELLNIEGELQSAQRKEYAERILRETQRMQTLIEDILMIARMESGELRYEREELDFAGLVQSSCEDITALAEESGLRVVCEVESCHIYASRREMQELVGNLTSNAVKYNREGGEVRLRLWMDDGAPMLSVFNTGEPIPETATDRIFERFFRVDKGRSKAVGGTGLGLAIVKHIAGLYGAKVSVIPHANDGNTFQVIFPPSVTARM